jgi:hypothetical protein
LGQAPSKFWGCECQVIDRRVSPLLHMEGIELVDYLPVIVLEIGLQKRYLKLDLQISRLVILKTTDSY